MAKQQRPSRPPDDPAWAAFAGRHSGHPFLELNPLYGMPKALVDLLCRRVPDLFTREDKAFEQDLAQVTHGGLFFFHRLLSCPLASTPPDPQVQANSQNIRRLMSEEMTMVGKNAAQIRRHFAAEEELQRAADLRTTAYTGWLVTNRLFTDERNAWRDAYGARVGQVGCFPAQPRSYFGERPGPVDDADQSFLVFCRRWCLDTFLTWDLPVPISPELSGPPLTDNLTISDSGVFIFLPWYALSDDHFKLRDLAKQRREYYSPDHLRGWLEPAREGGTDLGYTRYHNLLVLYRYWVLVLAGRYRERLGRKVNKLTWTFAKFLDRTEDTVKKLRPLLLFPQQD